MSDRPDERTVDRDLRIKVVAFVHALRRVPPERRELWVDELIRAALERGWTPPPDIESLRRRLVGYAGPIPYEPRETT